MKTILSKFLTIFLWTLLCVVTIIIVSCEKDEVTTKPELTQNLSNEIKASKQWLEKQMLENEQTKSWSKIYTPTFAWEQARMLISTQKDTLIEVPYLASRKYKFGIGPVGTKGEYLVSKYIEPQVTRIAISVKSGNFKARLMHLFCDTLIVGNKKIWYKPEVLNDIAFANSFTSSPNHAALIFYAGLDEQFQSYKYYEKGKVKEEGNTISSRGAITQPSLRSGCDLVTVATVRYACTGIDGYPLYCKPYVEYSYTVQCTDDSNPYDSTPDDPYTGGGAGSDNPQENQEEAPCTFSRASKSEWIGSVSSSKSPNLTTVTAKVYASCHIGTDGSTDRNLDVYVTDSYGGSATLGYSGNDLNSSFIGKDENNRCKAAHTYNVRATAILTPNVISGGGSVKGVSADVNVQVQPVSRHVERNPTFTFQ